MRSLDMLTVAVDLGPSIQRRQHYDILRDAGYHDCIYIPGQYMDK